jgi:hypothetical protein
MIEVIKEGVQKYRATCAECGAVFTYERDDVRRNFLDCRDEVACPTCGCGCRHLGSRASVLRLVKGRKVRGNA